jgi:trk system potassium uptake protein TrkA
MSISIAVLGLGKYGRSLAESMYALGADVMVVDANENLINEFSSKSTVAVCADLGNEDEVKELGLGNMDIVCTAMGSNLAASILSVSIAKDQGVPFVIAKSGSQRMASILKKVGVDKVVDPENENGQRSARILASASVLDFFDVDGNLCMVEIKPKKKWLNKSLAELNIRKENNINVVGMKSKSDKWDFADPHRPITESTTLLVVMEKKALKDFQ